MSFLLAAASGFSPSSLRASLTALFKSPLSPRVVRRPIPRRHLLVEKLKLQHASSSSPDKQALRERGLPSDAGDKFGFNPAKEPALPTTTVDGVAHRSTGERRAVRTNLGARRR